MVIVDKLNQVVLNWFLQASVGQSIKVVYKAANDRFDHTGQDDLLAGFALCHSAGCSVRFLAVLLVQSESVPLAQREQLGRGDGFHQWNWLQHCPTLGL